MRSNDDAAPGLPSLPASRADGTDVAGIVALAAERLSAAGSETAFLDAVSLYAHAAGTTAARALAGRGELPEPGTVRRFLEAVDSRAGGLPLAYILGRREFYGRDFFVDRRVLVPRPDTEALVEAALELARSRPDRGRRPRLHDAFTGSGCVGATLAAELPGWSVSLSDLSIDALAVARENSLRVLGRALPALVADTLPREPFRFLGGVADDEALPPWDIVTANPPYVASALTDELLAKGWEEPRAALDGGIDGLDAYRVLAPLAIGSLVSGGILAVEIGEDQADEASSLLRSAGFERVRVMKDLAGRDRVISGEKP